MAYSPDGRTLATASAGSVRLWNVVADQQIGSPLTVDLGVSSMAFSPDGNTLAIGSTAGPVQLWNVAAVTGQQLGNSITSDSYDGVQSAVFSPDGKTLAAATDRGAVLYSASARRQTGRAMDGKAAMTSIAFRPDGKILATGSEDGTAQLWDVATGERIRTFSATRSGWVKSVAFSPDGKSLVIGTLDDVQIWNVATGRRSETRCWASRAPSIRRRSARTARQLRQVTVSMARCGCGTWRI